VVVTTLEGNFLGETTYRYGGTRHADPMKELRTNLALQAKLFEKLEKE